MASLIVLAEQRRRRNVAVISQEQECHAASACYTRTKDGKRNNGESNVKNVKHDIVYKTMLGSRFIGKGVVVRGKLRVHLPTCRSIGSND